MGSVAQRRGKAVPENNKTMLISEINPPRSSLLSSATATDTPLLPDEIMPLELKTSAAAAPPVVAHVRRNFCGTGPFDRHWLNLDCCGLVCAALTYGLHLYAIYAVTCVLLPPWMSYQEDNNNNASSHHRHMTLAGVLHQILFTSIAAMAMVSHFKAMTTDPGAVPPDARPLECAAAADDPLSTSSSTSTGRPNIHNHNNNSLSLLDESSQQTQRLLLDTPPPPPPQVKRLCRRCKSFKPERAHHCSVCRRCIIKMDHHCPWVNNVSSNEEEETIHTGCSQIVQL